MIEADDRLSIQQQCGLLSLSRSGYYYVPEQETELNLRPLRRIDEIHYLTAELFGPAIVVESLEPTPVGEALQRKARSALAAEAPNSRSTWPHSPKPRTAGSHVGLCQTNRRRDLL